MRTLFQSGVSCLTFPQIELLAALFSECKNSSQVTRVSASMR
jgi:hypothetical protein